MTQPLDAVVLGSGVYEVVMFLAKENEIGVPVALFLRNRIIPSGSLGAPGNNVCYLGTSDGIFDCALGLHKNPRAGCKGAAVPGTLVEDAKIF
jgi:hypothetical protein